MCASAFPFQLLSKVSPSSLFLTTRSAECDSGASCAVSLALICHADWYRPRLSQGANQMPHQHRLWHIEVKLKRSSDWQGCSFALPESRYLVGGWSFYGACWKHVGKLKGILAAVAVMCHFLYFFPRWRLVVQVKEQRESWTEPGRDLLNSAGSDHSVYNQSKKYECCIIHYCYFSFLRDL